MGLAQLHSRTLLGLHAPTVTVEVHLANGLPSFTLVGLAEVEVREARERVRSAILNSGLEFPSNKRITVNLAPADLPKDSGRFDLPIALGILAASDQLDANTLQGFAFAGELSLTGALRPIRGALPMVLASASPITAEGPTSLPMTDQALDAPQQWVLPAISAEEAALVQEVTIWRGQHLLDVVAFFRQAANATSQDAAEVPSLQRVTAPVSQEPHAKWYPDMADIKGQAHARRALEIAAAGSHHVLMVGPPGAGKSMLAHRIAGILPPLELHAALQTSAMASLGGQFDWSRWQTRPIRAPHHTASAVALVGGGSPPRPGEISLAHNGVLFLDELPEFPKSALEALREPLETGTIHIARAARHAEFPARFQLIAAMNPCPCGYWGSSTRPCRCSTDMVARYQGRISGPLLDRVDLHIEVQPVPADDLLQGSNGEASTTVQQRVMAAHQRAWQRQQSPNQMLQGQALLEHAALSDAAEQLLRQAANKMNWSARAMHRVIRVARTIADLDEADSIESPHLAEAIQYRRALLQQ